MLRDLRSRDCTSSLVVQVLPRQIVGVFPFRRDLDVIFVHLGIQLTALFMLFMPGSSNTLHVAATVVG
jgi:hypothetical protein